MVIPMDIFSKTTVCLHFYFSLSLIDSISVSRFELWGFVFIALCVPAANLLEKS